MDGFRGFLCYQINISKFTPPKMVLYRYAESVEQSNVLLYDILLRSFIDVNCYR